jgi:CDP-diacylglycerol--inositol 3-phosphatidyltransferase
LYFIGFAADAVDGWVARRLVQTSKLGAVLDMVTDRCSTVSLFAILCKLAPDRYYLWAYLMLLDISSHWFQVQAAALGGGTTHKVRCPNRMVRSSEGITHINSVRAMQDTQSASFIVRFYYSNRLFMGFCCVSAEVAILCILSLCHAQPLKLLGDSPKWVAAALAGIHGQCTAAAPDVAVSTLLLLCLPGCAVKQWTNVAQLMTSAHRIAALDVKVE